jgi:hypothetical protein
MKVKIGPYVNWVGPYQIADALCFWAKPVKDETDIVARKPDWVHNFGTWLSQNKDGSDSWITKLCQWIHSKQTRQVYVRIDKYDTWGMDHTLALITLPMLKQLKATKHGSPFTDDEDVPDSLKSTSAEPKENEWDTDSNHFLRWDYILDEMIFAFECKLNDDWDAEFWTGEYGDFKSVPTGKTFFNPVTQKEEPTYTMEMTGDRECDWEARKVVEARIKNGFRLFGKYYEALWD